MVNGIEEFARKALEEDIGRGDLFERCEELDAGKVKKALIRAKSGCVFAGTPYAESIAKEMGITISFDIKDGEEIEKNRVIAVLSGAGTALLKAERTLLNVLQHASGVATQTRRYAKLIEGYGTLLLDTRKTRPLLRDLEKYAARTGGAVNHRFGLDDCLMIKDTHLSVLGDLKEFIGKARKHIPWTAAIEVECENLAAARVALEAGAEIVMCDNMDRETIREVLRLRDEIAPQTKIEASGNVTAETIVSYAALGVDAISCGSLIHQAVWPDFSMRIING
ncbi:MAG: carboxylating nicotinate-nucleotide diphosphorylase [Helicobacteraceae bacterium]|nr:carboxylating nicotinate-nucleotide diphosphorylase [Helicobacteraceae bacterium]